MASYLRDQAWLPGDNKLLIHNFKVVSRICAIEQISAFDAHQLGFNAGFDIRNSKVGSNFAFEIGYSYFSISLQHPDLIIHFKIILPD
jgi:hypothetical protein